MSNQFINLSTSDLQVKYAMEEKNLLLRFLNCDFQGQFLQGLLAPLKDMHTELDRRNVNHNGVK